jgi:6-phosphofructokinase 1
LDDHVVELSWLRVDHWTTRGGSELGTNRALPSTDLQAIAKKIEEHRIEALMIIGGYEAFSSLQVIEAGRSENESLRIPMVMLPAVIGFFPLLHAGGEEIRVMLMFTDHRLSRTTCR